VRVSDLQMRASDLQLSSVWAMINAGMLWIQLVYAMRSPMLECSTLLSPASMTEFPLLAPLLPFLSRVPRRPGPALTCG
jgi:hypothetical protein